MLNGFGDPAEIERLRAGLAETHGIRAAYVAADMAKPAEIRDLVAAAERRFGGVDILVNNAGIQHVAKIVDFPEERWDQVIAINLSAAFHATKAALPGMIARKWGRIINIASAHGLVASGEKAAYVTAKHGLVGLTKVTAIETANQGITCNAICPGWVLTAAGAAADRGARPAPRVSRSNRPAPTSCAKSSRCSPLRPPRRSPRWRCSCAAKPPRRSPARRCRSTAAGSRNRLRQDGRRDH